jgi:hypothetical protein
VLIIAIHKIIWRSRISLLITEFARSEEAEKYHSGKATME